MNVFLGILKAPPPCPPPFLGPFSLSFQKSGLMRQRRGKCGRAGGCREEKHQRLMFLKSLFRYLEQNLLFYLSLSMGGRVCITVTFMK